MEKVNFKNSRDLNLVGKFYSANSDKAVIMSHGFTGDKSEWGRFDKIAEALKKANYNVLSFDFSGCGESDDDSITVEKEVDDLKHAIDFIKKRGYKEIGLFGHSVGGLISLRNYNGDVKTMVLTAPVTDSGDTYAEEKFAPKQLKELEEEGYITKTRNKGIRRKFMIDKEYIIERKTLNQDNLLIPIKCPVLIVHGDKDDNVPLEWSRSAIKKLPQDSKLEIISGKDHDFVGSNEVIQLTVNWFKKHLK